MDTEALPDIRILDHALDHAPLPHFLIDDGCWLGDAAALEAAVLPSQDESRACALLEMGAPRIYLGEAALLDSGVVARLVARYGSDRIGVYAPCRRMEVSWSLETKSNADFKVVTPSICEPTWEVLLADGTPTGTIASWWLGAMIAFGAGSALLRADIGDDTDLNICAGLMETYGKRLWLSPLSRAPHSFGDWVRWGKATRLAVDRATYEARDDVRALAAAPQIREAA
ncbi:MAG TPA: hypothetical protein VF816_08285 [Rhodocyclaceae bacterium]